MVWVSEKVGEVVSWTLMLEEPLAERIALGVVARANMSVRWAGDGQRCDEGQGGRMLHFGEWSGELG